MLRPAFLFVVAMIGSAALIYRQQPVRETHREKGGEALDQRERLEWERRRLADPLTGKIPERWRELAFAERLPKQTSDYRNGVNGYWYSRGPWNVGGRTRAMAMDILNTDHIIAAGVSGDVVSTWDGGQTWTIVSSTGLGATSLAQDTRPGHEDTWYYTTGEPYGTSASGNGPDAFFLGDGVYKSTDGGVNWQKLSSTAAGTQQDFTDAFQLCWRVLVDNQPVAQDVVLCAVYGQILRSTDGGTTWSATRGGNSYFTDIVQTSTGVFYAMMSSDGTQKGIWRSTDGLNWANITPAGFSVSYDRIVAGINPDNENEVYFLASVNDGGLQTFFHDDYTRTAFWRYNYVSGDGTGAGGQWVDLSPNLPNPGGPYDNIATQNGYDLVVRVQSGTSDVFIGGTNIWRSTDGFTSPSNTTQIGGYLPGTTQPFFEIYEEHHPDQHEFFFHPTLNSVMYSASDGGIRVTNDCNAANVVWTSLEGGTNSAQFYTIAVDPSGSQDSVLIGGLQDNGTFFVNALDSTASWYMPENGDGAYCAIANNKTAYYVSRQKGKIVKHALDANGQSTGFNRIDPIYGQESNYAFIHPFVLDPNNSDIMYLPYLTRIYRNDSLSHIPLTGAWDSIAMGWVPFGSTTIGVSKITTLAVSKSNPANRLYYAAENGRIYKVDNANVGTPTHTILPLPPVSAGGWVNCIAIDPFDADRVLLVYSNYNFYSLVYTEDGGATWKKVGGNMEATLIGSGDAPSCRWADILVMPDGSRKYFLGTSVGLFSATELVEHTASNPGTEWIQESPNGIGNTVVNMVVCRQNDGLVVAASHGKGVWSANYSAAFPVAVNQPTDTRLLPTISPNPAVDRAELSWYSSRAETVQIHIINASGHIFRAQNFRAGQGTQRCALDVMGLPAGTYFCSITGSRQRGVTGLVIGR